MAVIRSGRAHGREARWRQSFTVGGHRERGVGEGSEAKRRGGMKQNNYQPVR